MSLDPEEFNHVERDEQTEACIRLWAAKLVLHAKDYIGRKRTVRQGTRGRPTPPSPYAIAEEWLFRDTGHYVGSFSWVCELLGHDPSQVRARINSEWREIYHYEKVRTTRNTRVATITVTPTREKVRFMGAEAESEASIQQPAYAEDVIPVFGRNVAYG